VADTIEKVVDECPIPVAADRLCYLRYARRLTTSAIREALDESGFRHRRR
jgi:hypothetical protein